MAIKKSWIVITGDSLPKMAKHPQHGHLLSESGPVLIKYNNGKKEVAVIGTCRQYLVDNNAPHIDAKKGDYYFSDTQGNKIDEPIAFFPLDDLVKSLEPEKEKSEAPQKNADDKK